MIFSEYGKPQVFRSDNGLRYVSQEFKFFIQNWSIEHRTSSPHYPQSNGLAESMVKVFKNLIEKAILQYLPWIQLLLDYRYTPISSEIPSPAEILFKRKLRSSISILPSHSYFTKGDVAIWIKVTLFPSCLQTILMVRMTFNRFLNCLMSIESMEITINTYRCW